MRILFDKGTPMPLRHRLFGHEVETSDQRGWDTLANGALMDRAEEAGFEVLLTTDQSIRYRQNMSNRQIAVVVLLNTNWGRISRNTEGRPHRLGGAASRRAQGSCRYRRRSMERASWTSSLSLSPSPGAGKSRRNSAYLVT